MSVFKRVVQTLPLRWRIRMCRLTLLLLLVVGIVPLVVGGAAHGAWMAATVWTVRIVHAMRNLVDVKEVTP